MFGMKHALNTMVGNQFIRGDNSTRSLDSSTAVDYIHALRILTTLTHSTNIVTLYQAGEQIYREFDKVCVIDHGRQTYYGPGSSATSYFESIGFYWNPRSTTADFLTSMTDPNKCKMGRESSYWKELQDGLTSYDEELRSGRDAQDFRDAVMQDKSRRSGAGRPLRSLAPATDMVLDKAKLPTPPSRQSCHEQSLLQHACPDTLNRQFILRHQSHFKRHLHHRRDPLLEHRRDRVDADVRGYRHDRWTLHNFQTYYFRILSPSRARVGEEFGRLANFDGTMMIQCSKAHLIPGIPSASIANKGTPLPPLSIHRVLTYDPKVCYLPGAQQGTDFVSGTDFLEESWGHERANVWRNSSIVLAFTLGHLSTALIGVEFPEYRVPGTSTKTYTKPHSGKPKQPLLPLSEPEPPPPRSRRRKTNSPPTTSSEATPENSSLHEKPTTRDTGKDLRGGGGPYYTHGSQQPTPGAGKTTLLDTLPQRKRVGVVSGSFLLDGKPLRMDFARSAGSAEQQDVHNGAEAPSDILSEDFDDVLLLTARGSEVYFGPIGDNGTTIVDYFERNGALKAANAAEYILEVGSHPPTRSPSDKWRLKK
ncbi:hypothetical protein L873DRAFT_1846304, partial [Choiromyces venosus 120613-1]